MKDTQSPMYFAEWNKARKALREYGRSPTEADAVRKKIHIKVGAVQKDGTPKSSKALNNHELDRCLAEFWVWSDPANLDKQLRQLDQPYTRAQGSESAQFFLTEIGIEEHGRKAYLDSICKRIFKKPLMDLDDSEWPDILGALNHTRMHKKGIAHGHRPKRVHTLLVGDGTTIQVDRSDIEAGDRVSVKSGQPQDDPF